MDDIDKLESELNSNMSEVYDEFVRDVSLLFSNEKERKRYIKSLSSQQLQQFKTFITEHALDFYTKTNNTSKVNELNNILEIIVSIRG